MRWDFVDNLMNNDYTGPVLFVAITITAWLLLHRAYEKQRRRETLSQS